MKAFPARWRAMIPRALERSDTCLSSRAKPPSSSWWGRAGERCKDGVSVHECKVFGRWRIEPSSGKGKIWDIYLNKLNKHIRHGSWWFVHWFECGMAHRQLELCNQLKNYLYKVSVFHQKLSGVVWWSIQIAVLNLAKQLGHTFFTIFFKKGIAKGVVSWFASNVAGETMVATETSVFFVAIKQEKNILFDTRYALTHLWGNRIGMDGCFQIDFKHRRKNCQNADCSAWNNL